MASFPDELCLVAATRDFDDVLLSEGPFIEAIFLSEIEEEEDFAQTMCGARG